MAKRILIAPNAENIIAVRERYYGEPALFMEEILGMELDDWQRDFCENFHAFDRHAFSSGHSSGKTAITAGITIYFITVHPDPQIITTANTENQLRQKTWRELAKWHNNSLVKDWFKWTATTFSLKGSEETWFAAAVPNTPHGAEGFAGAHEKYILQIFDEASAIDRAIWETAEGATATEGGYRKWVVFGNPTKTSGAFFDCFHRQRHRWRTQYLDTRSCRYADQTQIKQWIEDYGEDSDFVRIRVKGQFPRAGSTQLISPAIVEAAVKREVEVPIGAPKLFGVDVARFGDDQTVVCRRHGRKVEELHKFRGLDTMAVAAKVAEMINDYKPDAVLIDEVGVGGGVVDRLKQLGFQIIPVNSANNAEDPRMWMNKRAEMWGRMKEWLSGADIPDDRDLQDDLSGPEYGYDHRMRVQLEKKTDMKKRGLASPDCGDALALTFAYATPPVTTHSKSDLIPEWAEDF